jgi:glyceraldehyde-3-phosphate dehydrogenase/erythrose-4-phosphate dehydrogenase
LNATVWPKTGFLNWLTLWPTGGAMPVVSTLNSWDGRLVANAALVPTTNGSISAYASDLTTFLLDINGYFAP